MRTILTEVWRQLLEVLFPAICLNCKKHLGRDESDRAICPDCFSKIDILKSTSGERLLAVCLYGDPSIKALIHGLKFKHFTNTLPDIKQLISLFLENNLSVLSAEYDFITYIPLHPRRERSRGFNQSRLIAEIFAKAVKLPIHPILRRVRNTKEQSSIRDPKERTENVKNCFTPLSETTTVKDMNIILVDDVYTSGATALEAKNTLEMLGASKVTIFVLAKAG